MNDAIIVLNAGSSSLKFCIYGVGQTELDLVARGQIEGLGTSPRFKAKNKQGETLADTPVVSPSGKVGHPEAFGHLADWAREHYAAQYRLVHGGAKFSEPTLITADVLRELEQIVPLAPLHQPHNLAGIKAVSQLRPDLPQVACFDTAFHRNRPSTSERFGLPNDLFEQGVRRWGFHGLSYQFISTQLQKIAPRLREGRVIVAHIGSGASMCAMRGGR